MCVIAFLIMYKVIVINRSCTDDNKLDDEPSVHKTIPIFYDMCSYFEKVKNELFYI